LNEAWLRRIPIALFLILFTASTALCSPVNISGRIMHEDNKGIPGVTVSLFHPNLGRVATFITNSYGDYSFHKIQAKSTPYYIEVYWGKKLIYRSSLLLKDNASSLKKNITIK
jgi:hypothetical protein